MKAAARRLSAFGTRFARSGLRFARGGLRFSGRRRYVESALRVAVVVLVGAAIAYGGYLAVGLFFAFVAYILPYLFAFLALAVLLAVGWFLLLAGNTPVSSAEREVKRERENAEWKVKRERENAADVERESVRKSELKLDIAHKRALERERELKAIRDSK